MTAMALCMYYPISTCYIIIYIHKQKNDHNAIVMKDDLKLYVRNCAKMVNFSKFRPYLTNY